MTNCEKVLELKHEILAHIKSKVLSLGDDVVIVFDKPFYCNFVDTNMLGDPFLKEVVVRSMSDGMLLGNECIDDQNGDEAEDSIDTLEVSEIAYIADVIDRNEFKIE
jgi:hypothetical protein